MVVYEYEGIIDWFKENILGQKPPVKKEGKNAKKTKGKTHHHHHNIVKNLLLFGGIALVALMFLSKGEQAKRQAVGG